MIADFFTFYRKSYVFYFLTCNFKRNIVAVIYKYTVMFASYIKWNILIGNLRCSTTVFIPYIHYLSILYKCCKSFSKSVYAFSRIKRKFCYHIWLILCCHIVWFREFGQCCSVILHISQITESDTGKNLSISLISDLKIFQIYSYCHSARFHNSFSICDLYFCLLRILIQFISWLTLNISLIMIASDTDDILTHRSEFCSNRSYIKSAASVIDLSKRRNNSHSSRNYFCCKSLHCIRCIGTFILLPVTFCEFHS